MNYYELLEVSPHASKEVLRAAYKSLLQRHHPDKHQADSAMASRAALIVQAYNVLSDADQRAAYDLQLQQATVRPPPPTGYATPHIHRTHRAPAPASTSNWYLWLLATVILASGALIWSLSSQKKPVPPVAATAPAKAAPVLPDTSTSADPGNASPAAPEIRKLSLLSAELRVALAPTVPSANTTDSSQHILSIPAVTVEIGSIESGKFASLLTEHQDALVQKLTDKLAYVPQADLRIGGDKFLGRFIADALRDITGTRGLDDKADADNPDRKRYGVVAVSLPASFYLH